MTAETPEIRHLDDRTVQRIAAGEVVERPASVVKELVENSLDADASRVSVAVENGGKDGIRVRDDGIGIPEAQLEDAVAEHATSKIDDVTDLDAGVATLGFRGEALNTIGAVSRLTVRSRPRTGDGAGAELTVEGGEVGEVRPAGCPTGTTVEVEDLFYNTPARKKFLKTDATEFDHVNTVVTQYALANPDVAVSLEHNGRETFATEGNGDLRSTVLAVYGREVAEAMVDVEWEPDVDGDAAGPNDAPVQRVHGLVSHPETTRASRDYLATFVNERYVTASVLREAVVEAYGGQIAPDRYPFAVLFVEVPTGTVDVNVHPRKLEVRFDAEREVKRTVETAVEAALLDHGLIRSTAPRGRSAPDEAEVTPETPDEEVVGGAGTDHESAARARRGQRTDSEITDDAGAEGVASDAGADGVASDAGADGVAGDASGATDDGGTADGGGTTDDRTVAELAPDDEDAWTVDGLGGDDGSPTTSGTSTAEGATASGADDDSDWSFDPSGGGSANNEGASDASPAESPSSTGGVPGHAEAHTDADRPSPRPWQEEFGEADGDDRPAASDESRSAGVSATGSQRTLDGEATDAERAYDSLPSLRVLGQLHDTYVVAEAPDGLVLIDQHAADERVNYERLQAAFADGGTAQALAEPVTVELTAREAALFAEFTDDLRELGFRAERAGERAVEVSAVPAVFDATLDPELLRDALSAFVSDAAAGDEPVVDVVDELLADLACYPSVTGNTSLTEGSVVDLLEALDDCENPYACPHGRPVIIAFDRDDIEDRFERDYPGHAGRRAE